MRWRFLLNSAQLRIRLASYNVSVGWTLEPLSWPITGDGVKSPYTERTARLILASRERLGRVRLILIKKTVSDKSTRRRLRPSAPGDSNE